MNIIESNLQFKNLSYGNNPKKIFLHHAEAKSCTINDIHSWHLSNGWSGCGYHFLVRKDGSVYRGRPENAIGSHCKGHNTGSIGICAEGNYMLEIMPEVQKKAIIELCKYLCSKYGITDVRGHKEAPYATECPGVKYPLQEIKDAIKTPAESKYSVNYCLSWQQFYNRITKTKAPIKEDGEYGPNTQKSLDGLTQYIKQGKKYKYCLKFQKWYNNVTKTSAPLMEEGVYGPATEKALHAIISIIREF